MDKRELLDALSDRLHEEYRPATELLTRRRAKEAALTDEEWWDLTLARWPERMPERAESIRSRKEEMIRQRRNSDLAAQSIDPAAIATKKAETILPFLLAVRKENGVDGPLTDEQVHEATLWESQQSLQGMLRKVQTASEQESDPRRRRILATLAENAAIDSAELATLQSPDVTEERLQEVATGIAARMKALTKIVQSHGQRGAALTDIRASKGCGKR